VFLNETGRPGWHVAVVYVHQGETASETFHKVTEALNNVMVKKMMMFRPLVVNATPVKNQRSERQTENPLQDKTVEFLHEFD
jgi:hypothetical protein